MWVCLPRAGVSDPRSPPLARGITTQRLHHEERLHLAIEEDALLTSGDHSPNPDACDATPSGTGRTRSARERVGMVILPCHL